MVATPRQVYPDNRASALLGARRLKVLEGLGDQELPDATLTEVRRRDLKNEALRLQVRYSSYELIFLSSALESAANRRRAEELRRA